MIGYYVIYLLHVDVVITWDDKGGRAYYSQSAVLRLNDKNWTLCIAVLQRKLTENNTCTSGSKRTKMCFAKKK